MILRFIYRSHTQRVFHGAPFCIMISIGYWLVFRNVSAIGAGVAGGGIIWLVVGNFIINLLICRYGEKPFGMDFSRNTPSRTEIVILLLISIASISLGIYATAVLFGNYAFGRAGLLEYILPLSIFFIVASAAYMLLTFVVILGSWFRIRPVRG